MKSSPIWPCIRSSRRSDRRACTRSRYSPSWAPKAPRLDARIRAEGYSTLEELEAHYTGGDTPMSPLNYVWYQYRWQRIAAHVFDAEGEKSLVRFWNYFRSPDLVLPHEVTAVSLSPLLRTEVSETLGKAIEDWL